MFDSVAEDWRHNVLPRYSHEYAFKSSDGAQKQDEKPAESLLLMLLEQICNPASWAAHAVAIDVQN